MVLRSSSPHAVRNELVGLDILRLCAALFVVLFHFLVYSWIEAIGRGGIRDVIGSDLSFPEAVPYAWWGWIGVQVFFVISGFVITMSAEGKQPIGFAVGRIGRLFPGLLVFSTVSLAIVVSSGSLPAREAVTRWLRGIVLSPKGQWIDGAIWTLTVEAMFYAVVFLTLFSSRPNAIRLIARIWLSIITLFWASLFIFLFFHNARYSNLLIAISQSYASNAFLLTTGSYFLVGMFAYEIYSNKS